MDRKAILIAATVLSAGPALAAADPADSHLRTVPYSPKATFELPVSPGSTVRIELGGDEHVEQILVSDQIGMGLDPQDVPEPLLSNASTGAAGQAAAAGPNPGPTAGGSKWPPSCDVNMCRTVVGNFVYLRPLRALEPQPLFIQTKRCSDATGTPANCETICPDSNIPAAGGKCEMVPYTFKILTRPIDVRAASESVAWAISFTYDARDKAAALLAAQHRWAVKNAAWRDRQANKVPPPTVAAASDSRAYGYQGSAAVMPDETWDDGRTTFMRFKGNRRIPIIERILPDRTPSIAAYSAETDTTGTTIRIARTEKLWKVRDGDEAGCVFNVGSDPEGRTATTVATEVAR